MIITVHFPAPVVTVEVGLPARSLSPNVKANTVRAKIGRHRDYVTLRDEVAWSFKEKWSTRQSLAVAVIRGIFYHAQRKRRDGDNLISSMKAAYDGAQLARVIIDDSGFVHLPPLLRVDKDNPRLVIEVFDVDLRFETGGTQ